VHGYGVTHSNCRVWQWADGVIQIHFQEAHMWLEYYGHFATVSVLGLHHGELCGLCGDHDNDAGDDTAQVSALPCPGRQ